MTKFVLKTKCKYNYVSLFFINIAHRILTHWGQVTHTCVSKLAIIGSDNGLSPGRWNIANVTLRNKLHWTFSLKFIHFHWIQCIWNVVWRMTDILSCLQCVHRWWRRRWNGQHHHYNIMIMIIMIIKINRMGLLPDLHSLESVHNPVIRITGVSFTNHNPVRDLFSSRCIQNPVIDKWLHQRDTKGFNKISVTWLQTQLS